MPLKALDGGSAPHPPDHAPAELDAFAPEGGQASARGSAPASRSAPAPLVAKVLAGIVALQAVPAGLWVTEQLRPLSAVAGTVQAPAPPVLSNAPACEAAAPAPEVTASAPVAVPPAPVTPAPAAGVVAGVVRVAAPVPLSIYEGDRLVGTSAMDGLMLPVGGHELDLVSEEVGFRTRRSIRVEAGRPAVLRVDMPRVSLHVNALPWAEVWIDGERIGETPLGNIQQPLGRHEVVFRHPQLGERRVSVLVTLKEPARVSADLRKP